MLLYCSVYYQIHVLKKTNNMKPRLLYALLFIIVLVSGCFNDKSALPAPTPSGTFTGQFRRVHITQKTGLRDTLKANIQVDLNSTTGYKVTGDTSTVHAGSYGTYSVNSSYIQFNDATLSPTIQPAKVHLAGIYQYYFDGTVFQMVYNTPLDTVSLQYDLKKVN
jgi:hypothetical protein